MRAECKLAVLLACLACYSSVAAAAQNSGPPSPAKTTAGEMVQPADFVKDFPALKWGMSFADAKKAVEQTGARAARFKNSEDELAWDATFNGLRGRGALFFREGSGLGQIAIGVYAFEQRAALFDAWLKKITDRHGEPTENHDDESALIKLWRLKNGFAIQLRTLKDANSPVVELTWVKE